MRVTVPMLNFASSSGACQFGLSRDDAYQHFLGAISIWSIMPRETGRGTWVAVEPFLWEIVAAWGGDHQ